MLARFQVGRSGIQQKVVFRGSLHLPLSFFMGITYLCGKKAYAIATFQRSEGQVGFRDQTQVVGFVAGAWTG